ncbi:MAG: mviN, partial [Nocardioidaceae bacterium]|nr:mviN [Nocardioidaceae bacterium]
MTDSSRGLISASAWMALGTVVSRLTGFIRAALILVVLGTALNADIFTGANTVPNALYILVAGGVFNVVLVPQLIRTMRNDADGGEAYANRVVTLGLLVLAVATVLLILLVPALMHLAFNGRIYTPKLAGQRESAETLMRLCMPQVFFYGAFVLLGQILNARERFGPMMWAPISNNVVSCAVLGMYVVLFGTSNSGAGFTHGQELLLGLGSTAGIAVQALILVPYLRAAGFTFRPRFDFRGVGLSHTLKLGLWTLFFIIVNQIAFFVVQRIATGSTVDAALDGGEPAGSTVYQFAFLISQVPHGVITVSVVTAAIPLLSRLAADHQWPAMRNEVAGSLRIVLVAIAPIAVTIACLGMSLGTLMNSLAGLPEDSNAIGHTIMAFAPAMVFFTVHYLMLRGFYASEDTRTPFFIQVVLSVVNIGLAVALSSFVDTGLV